MSNHLQEQLRHYFSIRGNSYRFRNGLSLNKLAVEMEMDSARLSRIVSGEELFTAEQAKKFCELMEATLDEYRELQAAAAKDLCERSGFEFSPSRDPRVIDMFITDLALFDHAMDAGVAEVAIALLGGLYGHYAAIDDDDYPTELMIRVLSLIELKRERLRQLTVEIRRQDMLPSSDVVLDFYDVDSTLEIARSMPATELEQRLWQQHYIDGLSADEIAKDEGLMAETVLSILENWKGRLLDHLAEDPTNGQTSATAPSV